MSHAVRVHETGDASVLQWEEVSVAEPEADEVYLRHTAIGLNFIDVYFRSGTYPSPQLPFVPGLEGAGVIESIGEGVDGPCIIEEYDSTCLIPPYANGLLDDNGNIVINLTGQQ